VLEVRAGVSVTEVVARFGVWRETDIAHRLTLPRSPTTMGTVERFHQTLRRELLYHAGPSRRSPARRTPRRR
jgi:hypothetical protein